MNISIEVFLKNHFGLPMLKWQELMRVENSNKEICCHNQNYMTFISALDSLTLEACNRCMLYKPEEGSQRY